MTVDHKSTDLGENMWLSDWNTDIMLQWRNTALLSVVMSLDLVILEMLQLKCQLDSFKNPIDTLKGLDIVSNTAYKL